MSGRASGRLVDFPEVSSCSTKTTDSKNAIRQLVRQHCAEAALTVTGGSRASCGSSGSCCDPEDAQGEMLNSAEKRGAWV